MLEKRDPGPWFNIKMLSYQYRKFHCGDKTVVRSSYLHNGICYTGKTTSLYWIRALVLIFFCPIRCIEFNIFRPKLNGHLFATFRHERIPLDFFVQIPVWCLVMLLFLSEMGFWKFVIWNDEYYCVFFPGPCLLTINFFFVDQTIQC